MDIPLHKWGRKLGAGGLVSGYVGVVETNADAAKGLDFDGNKNRMDAIRGSGLGTF
jgi:hypothetical protein